MSLYPTPTRLALMREIANGVNGVYTLYARYLGEAS